MIFDTTVVLLSVATVVLLYQTYMDARYFLLPDIGNAILAALGLIYRATSIDWTNSVLIQSTLLDIALGALCGAGIFLFTRYISLKWKGVEGIGWGDVKFSAAAGIWVGPAGIGLLIGGSAGLLLLAGFAIIAITKRPLKDFYLPFGATACPAMIILLWAMYSGWVWM
jgi:leader peptidase (prepilin peptidase)/N-methyltransferase